MKKFLMILVAMLATLSVKAVDVEYFDPDTVCPELEGFHIAMGDKNVEDLVHLIDFLLNPYKICVNQIVFLDFNWDGEVDMRDVTDLMDFLLTREYHDPNDPDNW